MATKRPKPSDGAFDAHVTAGLCVLACGVTLMSWMGKDVSKLYLTSDAFFHEPWRMLSCVLPHANFRREGFIGFFHIFFNVMMVLRFGRIIEEKYGSLLTALFYVVVGIGSSTAQYAISGGGIGLSGIGYGVFGFLWLAQRRSREFEGSMDYRTIATFVGWFFFCIASTYFGVMHIANIAHGMGALLGAIIALFATSRPAGLKAFYGAIVAAIVVGCIAISAHPQWMPFSF